MLTLKDYRDFIKRRRGKLVAPPKPKKRKPAREWTPFLDWVLEQTERTGGIGLLARDIASECRRCERRLTQLNHRLDLMLYCDHAPKSARISREIAKRALREWIESEEQKDR